MRPRSTAKHRAILDAAVRLAGRRSYLDITMEAIAAEAGVGKQTLYRWWPSKAALYAEVYGGLVPRDMVSPDLGGIRDDLSAMLRTLFDIFRTCPAGPILMGLIAEAQIDAAARDIVMNGLFSGRRDLLIAPLERARRRGELSPSTDISALADGIVAMVWHRLLTRTEPPGDEEVPAIVGLLLDSQVNE
ncbi:MAG: TetR/AcrR family transcriptional regulator [Rhodospirillales bacterium]|nr:TetR/AcrR family transcriptional regulator [Rhodospirillales bacterium]